jgi:hypothetical protein
MISNIYCKISVSLGLVQNLEILDLTMEKIYKVNIAITYFIGLASEVCAIKLFSVIIDSTVFVTENRFNLKG